VEGNLVQLVERALPHVGEIRVADVPGRCEPGTGEISCPAVAAALDRLGYTGVVGLEGWASGDPELALRRFHTAFTVTRRMATRQGQRLGARVSDVLSDDRPV
jgi:hydroxypyruvate isomerase